MIDDKARKLAKELIKLCTENGITLGTVESCTGGLIGATLTAIDGSSTAFMGGLITYSNGIKHRLADVPTQTLESHGAVSKQTAIAMAQGGRLRLDVDLCVSVTGIAGPKSDTTEKPVGLVHFAVASKAGTVHEKHEFGNIGRDEVRLATVHTALKMLIKNFS